MNLECRQTLLNTQLLQWSTAGYEPFPYAVSVNILPCNYDNFNAKSSKLHDLVCNAFFVCLYVWLLLLFFLCVDTYGKLSVCADKQRSYKIIKSQCVVDVSTPILTNSEPCVPNVVGVCTPTAGEETTLGAVHRGCEHTHGHKDRNFRAVRRGCEYTHGQEEQTFRAVHRGCEHIPFSEKDRLGCLLTLCLCPPFPPPPLPGTNLSRRASWVRAYLFFRESLSWLFTNALPLPPLPLPVRILPFKYTETCSCHVLLTVFLNRYDAVQETIRISYCTRPSNQPV